MFCSLGTPFRSDREKESQHWGLGAAPAVVLVVQSSVELHPDEMIPPMEPGTVVSLYTTEPRWRHGAELAAHSASSIPRPYPQVPPLGVCCKVVINLPAISALVKTSYCRCSQSPPAHFSVLTSSSRSFFLSFRECMCREL